MRDQRAPLGKASSTARTSLWPCCSRSSNSFRKRVRHSPNCSRLHKTHGVCVPFFDWGGSFACCRLPRTRRAPTSNRGQRSMARDWSGGWRRAECGPWLWRASRDTADSTSAACAPGEWTPRADAWRQSSAPAGASASSRSKPRSFSISMRSRTSSSSSETPAR